MKKVLMSLAALPMAGSAQADPLIGPWPTKSPTEVLVLATPHLSGIEHMRPEWLEPLLGRLAAWKPRVITIEALSGPQCYLLRRYEKSWEGTAQGYCRRIEKLAALAEKTTGLDMPAAEMASEEAVAKLGPSSTPAERRRMAALFSAAGNVGSAATQWLRLVPAERRPGDGIDAPLVEALNEQSALRNENYWVAATLAARLGLERVYATDDHTSDRIQKDAPPGLGDALKEIWSGTRPPLVERAITMQKKLDGAPAALNFYRFVNRSDFGEASVRADMGRGFAHISPGQHGRRYVGWWETRNLNMIANIRAALARQPGDRALVVVGSTHKPYFDAYLGMMHEVRVVPSEQVLGK